MLILRQVIEYSAAETAEILELTPAAVNSALQGARKAVEERVPERSQQAELSALGPDWQRELIDAFFTAWEKADVNAIVTLLTEDVRFTMPPLPAWFDGLEDVRHPIPGRTHLRQQLALGAHPRERPARDRRLHAPPDGVFALGGINFVSTPQRVENPMRKLIVTNIVSLDGYFEGPGGNVMALPMDGAFDTYNAERLRAADTLLLGRRTFEMFQGFWPTVADNPAFGPVQQEISRLDKASTTPSTNSSSRTP